MGFLSQDWTEPHSFSGFVEGEPGVWSLSAALLSSFVSRRAGNWTWNPSPRYLGDRLSSLLRWTHYDVSDEWYMSVTLSVYISISPSLPIPSPVLWAGRAPGGRRLFNPFRLSQFSWSPGVNVFCECVFVRRVLLLIRREERLKAGHVAVNEVIFG